MNEAELLKLKEALDSACTAYADAAAEAYAASEADAPLSVLSAATNKLNAAYAALDTAKAAYEYTSKGNA